MLTCEFSSSNVLQTIFSFLSNRDNLSLALAAKSLQKELNSAPFAMRSITQSKRLHELTIQMRSLENDDEIYNLYYKICSEEFSEYQDISLDLRFWKITTLQALRDGVVNLEEVLDFLKHQKEPSLEIRIHFIRKIKEFGVKVPTSEVLRLPKSQLYLFAENNVLQALKSNWISLQEIQRIPTPVLQVIFSGNNGMLALEKGLLDMHLLISHDWQFLREDVEFDRTNEALNLRNLFCGNPFKALDEGLITMRDVLSMPFSSFTDILVSDSEVISLLREKKISCQDMQDKPSSHEITKFINLRKPFMYFRFVKNAEIAIEKPDYFNPFQKYFFMYRPLNEVADFFANTNVLYLESTALSRLSTEIRELIGRYFPIFENFALVDVNYEVVESCHPVTRVNFARQFNIGKHSVPSLSAQTTFFVQQNRLLGSSTKSNDTENVLENCKDNYFHKLI
ncbi:hypothetical protein [Legionella saoudiensis]|uniref:hypothetical protein n=1 Tax=Legionella saoudiensis TaxID=1750561 RepID=UPI0007303CF0|nr:hypothetical protein [Legionella saoudiensis]